MSETKKRKVHTAEFKAKVGLEALKGQKTINEIGIEYGVHPVTVGQWKKEIIDQAKTLFEANRGPKPVVAHQQPELLFSEIGKLKMELDWLKKVRDQPVMIRQGWIDKADTVPISRQCELSGICRATVYAHEKPKSVNKSDLLVSWLIDEEYTRHPFFGSRRMVVFLNEAGRKVNRKRVQGLMRKIEMDGELPVPAWIGDIRLLTRDDRGGDHSIPADDENVMDNVSILTVEFF